MIVTALYINLSNYSLNCLPSEELMRLRSDLRKSIHTLSCLQDLVEFVVQELADSQDFEFPIDLGLLYYSTCKLLHLCHFDKAEVSVIIYGTSCIDQ